MTTRFKELACSGGSFIGKRHRENWTGSDDAYDLIVRDDLIVAAVADGCSTGVLSSLGSQEGVRVFVNTVQRCHAELPNWKARDLMTLGCLDVLDDIQRRVDALFREEIEVPKDQRRTKKEYLLFTLLGAVCTPETSIFFSIGDGGLIINDEYIRIPSFDENKPPYVARAVRRSPALSFEERFKLVVHREMPTDDLQRFALMTDGTIEPLENTEPNFDRRGFALEPFVSNPRFATRRDAIRRALVLAGRDEQKVDWENRSLTTRPGIFNDDATLVVCQRIPTPSET